MNPKALSLGELYGEYDLNTNEWTDGILSSVMRTACAGRQRVTAGMDTGRQQIPGAPYGVGVGNPEVWEHRFEGKRSLGVWEP